MPLYKVENLSYYYPEAEKAALKDISLEIEEGEFILVAGGSGSGKSSLARALAGLIPDFYGGRVGGKVYFQGQDIRAMDRGKLAREVGTVFQDPEKQIVQTYVEAEIAFGLENLGLDNEEMQRRVAEVVCFMNLEQIREPSRPTLRRPEAEAGAGFRPGHAAARANPGRAHIPAGSRIGGRYPEPGQASERGDGLHGDHDRTAAGALLPPG